jgi:transcriptional/translational regulatory protein YebC/TACO1
MASYRVRTNTNNRNKTTQDKRIKTTKQTTKTKKNGSVKFFTFKDDILNISVHLQTVFAAETHLAKGQ